MLPFENHWGESYLRKAATPFPNWFNLNVCHHRTQARECNMLKGHRRVRPCQRLRLRMTCAEGEPFTDIGTAQSPVNWHRWWFNAFRTHSLYHLNLKMLFFNLIDLKVMEIGWCSLDSAWVVHIKLKEHTHGPEDRRFLIRKYIFTNVFEMANGIGHWCVRIAFSRSNKFYNISSH